MWFLEVQLKNTTVRAGRVQLVSSSQVGRWIAIQSVKSVPVGQVRPLIYVALCVGRFCVGGGREADIVVVVVVWKEDMADEGGNGAGNILANDKQRNDI